MKITIELDTEKSDHFEIECHKVAVDMARALEDLKNQIREWFKYDSRGSIPADEIKEAFNKILAENGIFLDKIWGA